MRLTLAWVIVLALAILPCLGAKGQSATKTGQPAPKEPAVPTRAGAQYLEVRQADGSPVGRRLPSSEWRFHRDIYAARPEVGAVLHAHSPFATALACLRRDIPPFHYMIARFGGDTVRCSGYATFGTQALSDTALAALDGRLGCLLANHGMIVCGKDLAQAVSLGVELESLCEQFWRASQLGEPVLLSAEEMAEALAKFATYGKQA